MGDTEKENDGPKKKRPKRMNREGSLRIRGNYFWARWMYRGEVYERSTKIRLDMTDQAGRPCGRKVALEVLNAYMEPFRHRDAADVLSLISRRLSDERDKEERTDPSRSIITLAALGDAFADSTRRNNMTDGHLASYKTIANEFAGFAGASRLACSVTEKIASQWADAVWKSGVAPHTFNMKISTMRQIWSALAPAIGAKENPWDSIKKKRNDAQGRRVLSDAEIDAVIDAAGDRYGGDLRLMLVIGRHTGMRIGDCATLKWEDVDFDSGFIRVVTQKTGEKVSIPLSGDFRTELERQRKALDEDYAQAARTGWEAYWDARPAPNKKERDANTVDRRYTGYVCPRMAERHIRDRTLVVALSTKTFKKAGVETSSDQVGRGVRRRPVAGFHSLRHGLASRLAAAGVSERIAMQILGHRSESVHDAYVHTDEGAIRDAFKRMELRESDEDAKGARKRRRKKGKATGRAKKKAAWSALADAGTR